MQQYGNTTTFNIEKVLYQNAIDSLYFKNNCVKLSAFEELVDEVGDRVFGFRPHCACCLCHTAVCMNCTCGLTRSHDLRLAHGIKCPHSMLMSDRTASQVYYKVDNVEPWMSGNARGATSAFCLLVRLGQLKPTDEQVQQLLDHTDSPYIRAVGACRLHLYQVRYCTTASWTWCSHLNPHAHEGPVLGALCMPRDERHQLLSCSACKFSLIILALLLLLLLL